MRLVSTSALSLSLFLTAACGSNAEGDVDKTSMEDDDKASGGSASTDEDEDKKALGGAPGDDDEDPAPGELSNFMITFDGDSAALSWELPDDEDLETLSYTLTPTGEKASPEEDATELLLVDNTLMLSELTSGTEYTLHFYLRDAANQLTESVFEFSSPGPQPVSDIFTLPLDNGVYMRWANPATPFESLFIRQGDDTPPTSLEGGEEVFAGTGQRALIGSLTNGSDYGFLFATVDADGLNSSYRSTIATPTADHGIVVDASAECDNYGYKISTTPWTQTFVRGEAGEDVLTGIEIEISKTGAPTESLSIRILDKNDDYLWSNGVTAAKIPSGTSWVGLLANGKGATNVPYELLEVGETYTIEVKLAKEAASNDDYYSWRTSTSGDCYPDGFANVKDRDFHFRTIHAQLPIY